MNRRSRRDDALREQLERSRASLFAGGNPRLLSALRNTFHGLESAVVVDWIPEQGEDIYTVVVQGNRVAVVEIDRTSIEPQPTVEVLSADEYARRGSLSKELRLKLKMALGMVATASQGHDE